MKDFARKVAVVTGAASGIGLELAKKFAAENMHVVLADIEGEPLEKVAVELQSKGCSVLAVQTNVLKEDDVKQLAEEAFKKYGNVHVLCNNAGVGGASGGLPIWESSQADFDWVFGVNFMGVLFGIRAFVPRMLASGEEGHIVNTASMAGLLSGTSAYSVSKHGVVCLTEGLYKEFHVRKFKLSASVLCPGFVNTNIVDSDRNRPKEYGESIPSPESEKQIAIMKNLLESGFQPNEVAQLVFDAIRDDRFYVMPAQETILAALKDRLTGILEQRNPTVPKYVQIL